AVQARQHDVEDDQVRLPGPREREPRLAVLGHVDHVTLGLEVHAQAEHDARIVFHDEDALAVRRAAEHGVVTEHGEFAERGVFTEHGWMAEQRVVAGGGSFAGSGLASRRGFGGPRRAVGLLLRHAFPARASSAGACWARQMGSTMVKTLPLPGALWSSMWPRCAFTTCFAM